MVDIHQLWGKFHSLTWWNTSLTVLTLVSSVADLHLTRHSVPTFPLGKHHKSLAISSLTYFSIFFKSCSTSFDSWHRNYFPIWHPPNLSPIWCKERRGGDVSCPLSLSPLMGYKAKSAVSPPTHQLHQSLGNLRGTFIMKLTSTCLSVTIKCHPVGKYFKYEVSPFVQCNEVCELFLFLFSCSCCEIRYL